MADTCSKGHAWTVENTIVRRDGRRRCRACTRAYERQAKRSSSAGSTDRPAYRDREYRANRLVVIRESAPYCRICGQYVDKALSGKHRYGPSVDHIVPVAHGGSHDISNLCLVHAICNSTKQDSINYSVPERRGTRSW